jgi:hypothetical protein
MKTPIKATRVPVKVSAIQWTGENIEAVLEFVRQPFCVEFGLRDGEMLSNPESIYVRCEDGNFVIDRLDWLVRSVAEFEVQQHSDDDFRALFNLHSTPEVV